MDPYLRKEDDRREFDEILEVAGGLFSKRKSNRETAARRLVEMGRKSVRPLVYALECGLASDMSDDEVNELADDVENVLIEIGKEALPDLEDFATNKSCNIYVNDFAQQAIFKILGLEGKDRMKVCKHMMRVQIKEKNKKAWQCVFCGARFGDEKRQGGHRHGSGRDGKEQKA